MSVGPAALGNVLVQRLDAVLGTTMSAANANQVSGARPDAVSQPGGLDKPGSTDGSTRDPRQGIQTGGARGDRQNTVVDPKTAAALALAARGLVTSSDTTASAPTTLGTTARAILALLAQFPEAAPAVQGRAPLWNANAAQGQPAGQPAAGQPAAGQPAPPSGQLPTPSAATPAPAPAAPATPASLVAATDASTSAPAAKATASAGQANAAHGAEAAAHASMAASGPSARLLGQALRQALQTSGLFYESHLTDMVFGRTNPAALRNEPQAQLSKDAAPQNAAAVRSRPEASAAARSGGSSDAPSGSGASNTSAPGAPVAGIHQDLNVLVRQQLDVLANQSLTWQGEAWPGTPMEWEVERDPYGGDPDSATPTWATRLKLDLPRLGLV
ncbi:MAG: flagellar hook-length control protein FliK, partial [Achromobacter sp.]